MCGLNIVTLWVKCGPRTRVWYLQTRVTAVKSALWFFSFFSFHKEPFANWQHKTSVLHQRFLLCSDKYCTTVQLKRTNQTAQAINVSLWQTRKEKSHGRKCCEMGALWTPVARITWPCTDGALVPPANGPLALFSRQLDPLRNRFHHFDSCVCLTFVQLDVTASNRKPSASETSSNIRFSPPCNALSPSPPDHASHPPLRLFPSSVCRHSSTCFHCSIPRPLCCPSSFSHLTHHLLCCPQPLVGFSCGVCHCSLIRPIAPQPPPPPTTTPVCPFISPCLTVLYLTSASLTHTSHNSVLSVSSLNTLVHYLDVPISGRLPFVTLAPPPLPPPSK